MTNFFLFIEFVVNFDSIIINFSSRFHICSECDVQFSSISRLLVHAQKNCNKVFTCKHCEKTFALNNKFYKHVRLHYIKKNYNNKTLKQRFVEKRNNHINLSISRFIRLIIFKSITTSTKSSSLIISITKAQIARFIVFSIDFSSMNSIAFKSSRRHCKVDIINLVDETLANVSEMKNVKCNNIYLSILKLKIDFRKIREHFVS